MIKLTDSPMPQDLLQEPHGPQAVTWQFRGSVKENSINVCHLKYFLLTLLPLSALFAQPSFLVSQMELPRPILGVIRSHDLVVQRSLASCLYHKEM